MWGISCLAEYRLASQEWSGRVSGRVSELLSGTYKDLEANCLALGEGTQLIFISGDEEKQRKWQTNCGDILKI